MGACLRSGGGEKGATRAFAAATRPTAVAGASGCCSSPSSRRNLHTPPSGGTGGGETDGREARERCRDAAGRRALLALRAAGSRPSGSGSFP
eukprot:365456-Chlamydomonas_euryale.AAC.7